MNHSYVSPNKTLAYSVYKWPRPLISSYGLSMHRIWLC